MKRETSRKPNVITGANGCSLARPVSGVAAFATPLSPTDKNAGFPAKLRSNDNNVAKIACTFYPAKTIDCPLWIEPEYLIFTSERE